MPPTDSRRALEIRVRNATPSDATLLAELGARTFRDTFADAVNMTNASTNNLVTNSEGRSNGDDAFALLESTITEVFPDAVPAPYVMMAATDSRHFTEICERVYRFTPFRMTKAQRESLHSYDERIGVDDFVSGIDWYQLLIERLPS